MNGGTDRWTENLLILQDFIPYPGHCPAYKEKQGEGIADHLMSLGDWFRYVLRTDGPTDGPSLLQCCDSQKKIEKAKIENGEIINWG